jgi:hypothetical protein
MRPRLLWPIALAFLALAPTCLAEHWRNHFDADAAMRPPAFFDFQVLGRDSRANWLVLSDHNPPSAPNQLTQTVASRLDGSIAVALRRGVNLQNGSVSVALKRLPSRAGLVLRMANDKDFLVLLLDGHTGDARLAAYRDGAESELARGRATIERDWGILEVSLSGATIAARWNQKPLLQGTDPHPAAGRVGVATEGSGNASFDEFVIDTEETR